MTEAPYVAYADLLMTLGRGLPLYDPNVRGGVHLGDVGYLQFGRFERLFNIFNHADLNARGVPDNLETVPAPEQDKLQEKEHPTSGYMCSSNVKVLVQKSEQTSARSTRLLRFQTMNLLTVSR
jgi:hypothetical protein